MTEIIYDSISMYIAGPIEASGDFSLYIPVDPNPSGDLTLFTQGPRDDWSWDGQIQNWENYNYLLWQNWGWGIASGIIHSGLAMVTAGAESITSTGSMPLFIRPFETTGYSSGYLDLYTQGPIVYSGDIPLFVKVDSTPSGVLNLYIKGTDMPYSGYAYSGMSLFTNGAESINVSGTLPLFLKVSNIGDLHSDAPLYTSGKGIDISSSVPLFVKNSYASGGMSLFIGGYWTTLGSQTVTQLRTKNYNRKGGTDASALSTTATVPNGRDLEEIVTVLDPYDSRTNLHITTDSLVGTIPIIGSMPLYLHHTIGTGNSFSMYVSGVPYSTGSMSMYMYGAVKATGSLRCVIPYPVGVASGELPLNIIGYF